MSPPAVPLARGIQDRGVRLQSRHVWHALVQPGREQPVSGPKVERRARGGGNRIEDECVVGTRYPQTIVSDTIEGWNCGWLSEAAW
jgi:hypothetical protein